MSEQQRDFDAIMKRVEADLRKPGGLMEQLECQLRILADDGCSTTVELSDFEAKTEDRLSRLEAKVTRLEVEADAASSDLQSQIHTLAVRVEEVAGRSPGE